MVSTPDIAEVICAAAQEAGITVTLRQNRDGSRQIIENGEVTSGFLSSRGNFCYSSSGKARKGGPPQLVHFYLGLDREATRRWLRDRFGFPRMLPSSRRPAWDKPATPVINPISPHPAARIGPSPNSPDCLARGPKPAMDVSDHFPQIP